MLGNTGVIFSFSTRDADTKFMLNHWHKSLVQENEFLVFVAPFLRLLRRGKRTGGGVASVCAVLRNEMTLNLAQFQI